jgi:hypothetical protein
MNGLNQLRSMLPHQGYQPAAGARMAFAPTGAAGPQVSAPAVTEPPAPTTTGASDVWQQLSASLQALREVADTLRAQLESMLGDTSGSAAVASSVSASIRQRASFEFITQEGDVVELSVRSRAALSSSSATVQDANGSASATQTTLVSSSRLSVQVHGNLNDEEMAAIKDVLGQVETLADKFFSGDVQAAFAASSSLHIDTTQLASMALEFASRVRIRGVAASSAAPSAPTPPTADTPPASVQPAVNFLGAALGRLQSVASIDMSMKTKLQLLLIAVMPSPTAGASAGAAALDQLSVAAPRAA